MSKEIAAAAIGAGMAGRTHANAWRQGLPSPTATA